VRGACCEPCGKCAGPTVLGQHVIVASTILVVVLSAASVTVLNVSYLQPSFEWRLWSETGMSLFTAVALWMPWPMIFPAPWEYWQQQWGWFGSWWLLSLVLQVVLAMPMLAGACSLGPCHTFALKESELEAGSVSWKVVMACFTVTRYVLQVVVPGALTFIGAKRAGQPVVFAPPLSWLRVGTPALVGFSLVMITCLAFGWFGLAWLGLSCGLVVFFVCACKDCKLAATQSVAHAAVIPVWWTALFLVRDVWRMVTVVGQNDAVMQLLASYAFVVNLFLFAQFHERLCNAVTRSKDDALVLVMAFHFMTEFWLTLIFVDLELASVGFFLLLGGESLMRFFLLTHVHTDIRHTFRARRVEMFVPQANQGNEVVTAGGTGLEEYTQATDWLLHRAGVHTFVSVIVPMAALAMTTMEWLMADYNASIAGFPELAAALRAVNETSVADSFDSGCALRTDLATSDAACTWQLGLLLASTPLNKKLWQVVGYAIVLACTAASGWASIAYIGRRALRLRQALGRTNTVTSVLNPVRFVTNPIHSRGVELTSIAEEAPTSRRGGNDDDGEDDEDVACALQHGNGTKSHDQVRGTEEDHDEETGGRVNATTALVSPSRANTQQPRRQPKTSSSHRGAMLVPQRRARASIFGLVWQPTSSIGRFFSRRAMAVIVAVSWLTVAVLEQVFVARWQDLEQLAEESLGGPVPPTAM